MTGATASAEWLAHPAAGELLRLNLLPSTLLNPTRMDEWSMAALHKPPLAGLHRHWSDALLARAELAAPVLALGDPALPLALLPAPRFHMLLLRAGAALLAGPICRTVVRDEVAALREQLGDEVLALARTRAGRPSVAPNLHPDWEPGEAGSLCQRFGAGLLWVAFEAAEPALAARARLRLPVEAEADALTLSEAGLAPPAALALARELVQQLEPAWLSAFPAPH
jgi:hypothetical protein